MEVRPDRDKATGGDYVSTAHLPPPELVQELVSEAHQRFKSNAEGRNSDVYPALARAPRELFGICLAGTGGNVYVVGDADHEFTIMSVSKPFVFALVCQEIGAQAAREKLGANATGLPFNSLAAVERSPDGRAIASTSLVPGMTADAKWRFIHAGLSRFAGRTLALNEEVYASASQTNHRNQGIARLLQSLGRIYFDPAQAIDLYTRQCCLNVSAKDLAVMGATLANGGVNPLTKERAVDADRLPLRAGRHDNRRPVRDVWRLALRRRPAGQERHRRRDRHRLSRQGRLGHFRAAARPCGQQHQGTAGRQIPVAEIGNGFVRVAVCRLTGLSLTDARLPCLDQFAGQTRLYLLKQRSVPTVVPIKQRQRRL